MFILQAPSGSVQVTTVLPSPEWSDSYKLKAENRLKRSMSNVVYTYIKSANTYRLSSTFTLAQGKMLELLKFIETFYATMITITDHNGVIWIGFLASEPASFEAIQVKEVNTIVLEWDASKIG